MQLLIQEFYNKIGEFMNNMKWTPIKILSKLIFYGLILYFVGWFIYRKYYMIFLVILCLWCLAELAHYIRKSREKVMVDKATIKGESFKKPKNKNLLFKKDNKIHRKKETGLVKAEKIKVVSKSEKAKNKDLLS